MTEYFVTIYHGADKAEPRDARGTNFLRIVYWAKYWSAAGYGALIDWRSKS